jgi:hypothetical protein
LGDAPATPEVTAEKLRQHYGLFNGREGDIKEPMVTVTTGSLERGSFFQPFRVERQTVATFHLQAKPGRGKTKAGTLIPTSFLGVRKIIPWWVVVRPPHKDALSFLNPLFDCCRDIVLAVGS